MLENIGFFPAKRKNHLIFNNESGGKAELSSCPNYFVSDGKSVSRVPTHGNRLGIQGHDSFVASSRLSLIECQTNKDGICIL